jgi:hypothetical protein
MRKTIYGTILIVITLSFTGCGNMPQHIGTIPKNVSSEKNKSLVDKTNYSEIICAKGERQVYYVFPILIGWSTPELTLKFDDEGFSFFSTKYNAVKLAPAKRDFTLRFQYRDTFANFEIKQFDFEKDTKYFAKYSTFSNRIRVWIEKEDGTVVYGTKPKEGSY